MFVVGGNGGRRRVVLRVPNNGDADVIIETVPPIAPQDTAGLQTVGLVFVLFGYDRVEPSQDLRIRPDLTADSQKPQNRFIMPFVSFIQGFHTPPVRVFLLPRPPPQPLPRYQPC